LNKSTFQHIAIAGALCLGLAASAAAQDRPGAPGGPQQAQGARAAGARGPREGDRQKRFADMKQRREQRLHDLLQIRPEQDAAFRTFMTALDQARPQRGQRPDGQGADGQRGRQRGPQGQGAASQAPLTTPERLDRLTQRMAQRTAERRERLQKTTAAVKTFYAMLSPGQRKAFDQLPVMRIGDRGGGHRSGHGGGGFQGRAPVG